MKGSSNLPNSKHRWPCAPSVSFPSSLPPPLPLPPFISWNRDIIQRTTVGICSLFPPGDQMQAVRWVARDFTQRGILPAPAPLSVSCFLSNALKNKWIVWLVSSYASLNCRTPLLCYTMTWLHLLTFLEIYVHFINIYLHESCVVLHYPQFGEFLKK